MAHKIKDKAFWITCVLYTRVPNDTLEAYGDRLYRTVDNLLFLTEDQKEEFYTRLAERLTKDMALADAWNTVTTELEKALG